METVHEIVFHPEMVNDFKQWLEKGDAAIPGFITEMGRHQSNDTPFQHIVRNAIGEAGKDLQVQDSRVISLGEAIPLKQHSTGMDFNIIFLTRDQTDSIFSASRVNVAKDIQALRSEEMRRLGVIRAPPVGDNAMTILIPYEALHLGIMPSERQKRLATILSFQFEKAKNLSQNNFQDEYMPIARPQRLWPVLCWQKFRWQFLSYDFYGWRKSKIRFRIFCLIWMALSPPQARTDA